MFHLFKQLICFLVIAAVFKIGLSQTQGDVRLFRGDDRSGIVQIYSNSTWYTVCGRNFDNTAGTVVCRQLGLLAGGSVLPLGAFGELSDAEMYPEQFQGCSTGQESNLLDCEFSGLGKCTPHRLSYASLKCVTFTEPTPAVKVELEHDTIRPFPESGYLSPVKVYTRGSWGHVCGEFWDDVDAIVVCRQLGFSGGVAAAYEPTDWTLPVLVTDIQCDGSETQWEDCTRNDTFCYEGIIGSVFCYEKQNQGPVFSLVGGTERYGTLVLTVDGRTGLVCDDSVNTPPHWYYEESAVACRMMGFTGGYPLDETFNTGGVTDVFLSNVECKTGQEDNLFQCHNDGWKNVSLGCQTAEAAVSVYCYTNVRLTGGAIQETTDLLIGRVEVHTGGTWQWHGVCADVMTPDIALLTCKEFGFTDAEILLPDSFSSSYYGTDSISSITCSGSESSLSECKYTLGRCPQHLYTAALACKHSSTHDGLKFLTSYFMRYYDVVSLEKYGVTGRVCTDGWSDAAASVVCRQVGKGHSAGIAMANRPSYSTINPVWATRVNCTGSETSLIDCDMETDMSTDWNCADNSYRAGALCFLDILPDTLVRLADGRSSGHGRAEVYNDVSGWGTICNDGWGNTEAKVFCRQAGYATGQMQVSAWRTQASVDMSIVLSGVDCEGTETSIFQCGNKGWLNSYPCKDHSEDAGVYCYPYVELTPGFNYGAVQYHTGEEYGLVCADGFDDNAATVVCQGKNFPLGMALCCSALGPLDMEFTMSNVNCNGRENALTDCAHVKGSSCSSGTYAAVVCGYYFQPGIYKIYAGPVVQIMYNSHEGLVCSEKFTDADATVVCTVVNPGRPYGRAFKASAKAHVNTIRWLNGLGCDGSETSLAECGPHTWGQVGVCSWDSVAAVICSDNEADLEFDIRIVNGTQSSGRVEIKMQGIWNTIYGTHLTRQEASVICRELGFHGGINLTPGTYGGPAGQVNVLLEAIKCTGTESSVTDCIWTGYHEMTLLTRDHTEDAAVQCFHNIRLAGSTLVNYGRLEMYDSTTDIWYAVCDGNVNINTAQAICQQMGYNSGRFQRGSALGQTTMSISIRDIDCSQPTECTFTKGTCTSKKYLSLYCSDQPFTNEDFDVKLPLSSFYGPLSVRRFGLWGHVCSVDFDHQDAKVACRELGYTNGTAVRTYRTSGQPVIQGGVHCSGEENMLSDCQRGLFAEDTMCLNVDTVAGVICYNSDITLTSAELDVNIDVMKTRSGVQVDGNTLYIAYGTSMDLYDTVYCSELGYSGGDVFGDGRGSYGISDLTCTGTEDSILQCPGTWDPEKTRGLEGSLAGVRCYTSVRLVGGGTFYGAVMVTKGGDTGLVCEDNFNHQDARAVCQSLNSNWKGLSLCCTPFGTVDEPALVTNVTCPESVTTFTDCTYDLATGTYCQRNYAAVVCYSGLKNTDYSLSLDHTDSYNGGVIVTYLGVNGSICMNGWDDRDAHVACRELGYPTGIAYNAARTYSAPYWISNVQCTGLEASLSDCPMTGLGDVTSCNSRHSHAGVLCYNNEGLFARLAGTDETRYGRVEISLDGDWRSLCNTHWDHRDAHVVCQMLNYRTGEAYTGSIPGNKADNTASGPVWDTNFMCTGVETSLTACMSSGWRSSTSVRCASHKNDAAAFCYTSVKLSTGVGRETDQGAVLLYMDRTWYKVCADGFTQQSASVVCKELGFRDGEVQTGLNYGPLNEYPTLVSHQMTCSGDESDAYDCLTEDLCDGSGYASVVCYQFVLDEPEKQPQEEKFNALPIVIGIVVAVAVIVIFVVVFYCVRKQKKKRANGIPYDDVIVRQARDGSVYFSNPMQQTPEVPRAKQNGGNEQDVNPTINNPGYAGFQNRGDKIDSKPVDSANGAHRTVLTVTNRSDNDPHLYDSIKERNLAGSHARNQANGGTDDTPYYLTVLPENAEIGPASS